MCSWLVFYFKNVYGGSAKGQVIDSQDDVDFFLPIYFDFFRRLIVYFLYIKKGQRPGLTAPRGPLPSPKQRRGVGKQRGSPTLETWWAVESPEGICFSGFVSHQLPKGPLMVTPTSSKGTSRGILPGSLGSAGTRCGIGGRCPCT
jgi:hypothetical protein